jgi:L-ascorbate metabolism protein UlaG (beta-lactamase superfamily)
MLAAAFAATAGCGGLPVTRPPVSGQAIDVRCCSITSAPVDVTYLGVGGWLVRRGRSAILFAPLFSNPSFARAGFSAIGPDTLGIDRAIGSMGVDLSDVALILSGHGHYDHLMDVPRVMEKHAPRAVLLANRTSAHQLAPWSLAGRIVVVSDSTGDRGSAGRWIVHGDVRVMPFRSKHAPHLDGYTLYEGVREHDLREAPATALDWLDGESVSYLIDFLDGDSVAFRIYYQDAVAPEPYGLVTDTLLRGASPSARSVDLAFLVPSTFAEVPWHPEAVIENLRPRHVMLGHWEDMFRPPLADPEPLFLNDFRHFIGRLRRVLRAVDGPRAEWHMPVAGTRFRIR